MSGATANLDIDLVVAWAQAIGRHPRVARSQLVVLLCAVLLVSSCTPSKSATDGGLPLGHALDNQGIQTGSSIEMHGIRPGDRIYLSFPILTNVSDQAVVVLDASFVALPRDVRLLAYKRFTVNPAVGHLLTYKLDDPAVPGYGALPKPFNGRLRIDPGETSPHYYVGDVEIEQAHR